MLAAFLKGFDIQLAAFLTDSIVIVVDLVWVEVFERFFEYGKEFGIEKKIKDWKSRSGALI